MAEAQQHHDGVGGIERGGVGETAARVGVNETLGVHGEEHGAFEAVALAENLPEHRQALLAAILLIASDKHDVRALAGAGLGLVSDPGRFSGAGSGDERGGKQRGKQATGEDRCEFHIQVWLWTRTEL